MGEVYSLWFLVFCYQLQFFMASSLQALLCSSFSFSERKRRTTFHRSVRNSTDLTPLQL